MAKPYYGEYFPSYKIVKVSHTIVGIAKLLGQQS